LQYEKKKYMREENDVDGYGNDMVLYDNQTLDLTDRALSLLFFSKTNKGFNFGLTIPTTLGNSPTDNITRLSTPLLVRSITKLHITVRVETNAGAGFTNYAIFDFLGKFLMNIAPKYN
ncbi:hypothetical protein Tco_1366190, partial [Tanacetum coccineum]